MSTLTINVDLVDVLNELSVDDVVTFFGNSTILGEIDPGEMMAYIGEDAIEYIDDSVIEDHYLNTTSVSDQLGNYSTEQLMDELIIRGVDISM